MQADISAKRSPSRGHDPAVDRRLGVAKQCSVNEFPSVSAVEVADSDRSNQARVEVAKFDAVLGAWRWVQGLPMCDAAARFAANCPESLVTPDVLGSTFGMAFDLDRSEFVIHRRTADTAAERTVAVRGHLGWKRQSQTHGTAVARTFKHVSSLLLTVALAREARRTRWRRLTE